MRSEHIRGFVESRLDVVLLRHVAFDCDRSAASILDQVRRLLGIGLRDPGHDDAGILAAKASAVARTISAPAPVTKAIFSV